MKNVTNQNDTISLKSIYCLAVILLVFFNFSCSKQDVVKQQVETTDSSTLQINYLSKIKSGLRDSLSAIDFAITNFTRVYRSKDARSNNDYLRLYFTTKSKYNTNNFILLKADSSGNILGGKIVYVEKGDPLKSASSIALIISSLNRKKSTYFPNAMHDNNKASSNNVVITKTGHVSFLFAAPVEDPVVMGYDGENPVLEYWLLYDYFFPTGSMLSNNYTYGSLSSGGGSGGGGGSIRPDNTIIISYENTGEPTIDVSKYMRCFSLISNQDALIAYLKINLQQLPTVKLGGQQYNRQIKAKKRTCCLLFVLEMF